MFRISSEDDVIVGVETVEEIEPTIRSNKEGRDHIDEFSATPLPFGHTARRRGIGIKRPDRAVTIDPDPWDA
jgi:hypothetical protein